MIRSPFLMGTTSERDGLVRMAAARMTVGALPLVATGLARRVFGLPEADDRPSLRAVARLFGVRNVVIGLWVLGVADADDATRRRCYQLNAAVDVVDVAVLLWPVLRRQGLDRFGLSATALGASATAGWVELLQRSR